VNKENVDSYEMLIVELLEKVRSNDDMYLISCPKEVSILFNKFHNSSFVRNWKSGKIKDITPFATRWAEQAYRMALCFHMAEYGFSGVSKPLEAKTALDAIDVIKWFMKHQMEILNGSREAKRKKRYQAVISLIAEKRGDFIIKTDVYRKRITRNAKEAELLLNEMVDENLIKFTDKPSDNNGRITRIYYLDN
jgi:hypothetical protein